MQNCGHHLCVKNWVPNNIGGGGHLRGSYPFRREGYLALSVIQKVGPYGGGGQLLCPHPLKKFSIV